MIQFDYRREVFQPFYFLYFWNSFKVICKTFMCTFAVRSGETLIGVASHDRVKVKFLAIKMKQAPFSQVLQISIECIFAFGNGFNCFESNGRTEASNCAE